ncbi:MAG: hypothetical protein KY395_02035 [Actinobacteria bacterium]|nr:hypothetical protein [Actinomycetota bacterium]
MSSARSGHAHPTHWVFTADEETIDERPQTRGGSPKPWRCSDQGGGWQAARAGPDPGDTVKGVADDHVWTAEELERLRPQDRQRLLDERVVTDVTTLPPDFVERVRREGRELMEQRGTASRTADGG